jgi:hypothetical protein
MNRTAATSKTMKADQWRSAYVEKFAKHGMGYRAAGIVDLLADSMEVQSVKVLSRYLDTPVDSQGRPYDNIRHSDVPKLIQRYYKNNNLDYDVTENYRNDQSISSWSDAPLAMKALMARSRTVSVDRYRWQDDASEADNIRSEYAQNFDSWEESMIAMHSWTYEQLSKIKMPNIDRKNGTITLWRTEGEYLYDAIGSKPTANTIVKAGKLPRGALESTSLFTPISADAGGLVTRQVVPIHRVFADFMLQVKGQGSGFLEDRENEATVMLEGIDFEFMPSKKTGHSKPSSAEYLKYNPKSGDHSKAKNALIDDDDDDIGNPFSFDIDDDIPENPFSFDIDD